MMRKLIALLCICALAASACSSGGGKDKATSPADDLKRLATLNDARVFHVKYSYGLAGTLATAVETEMEYIQKPPDSLRRIQTTTVGDKESKRFTQVQWFIASGAEFYSCYSLRFPDDTPKCLKSPPPRGLYGYSQIDEVLGFVRDPKAAFKTVKAAADTKIAGLKTKCFIADAKPTRAPLSTPEAASTPNPNGTSPPIFDPTEYRFDLCYSNDGILMRMRRTAQGPLASGQQAPAAALFEATSLTRTVKAADFKLPGEVFQAKDSLSTPTPKPKA